MKTIAIIDDDIHIGNMLEEVLTKEGYGVFRAYSGTEALYLLSDKKPDLVLLDLMMPGLGGEEVLLKISDIPVIIVSAKIGIDDKVKLLLNGAADYVTKPFEVKELLARITVQLRRKESKTEAKILRWGSLELDTIGHILSVVMEKEEQKENMSDFAKKNNDENGLEKRTMVKLTKTEYAILKLFLQNPKQVISKSVILERISQDTPDCTENSLKIHISNLRKKLREASGKEYIEAVWGIGFKLAE